MTTIYKVTIWRKKGDASPEESFFTGDNAETQAWDVFHKTNASNSDTGHLVKYDSEDEDKREVLGSFDWDYFVPYTDEEIEEIEAEDAWYTGYHENDTFDDWDEDEDEEVGEGDFESKANQ